MSKIIERRNKLIKEVEYLYIVAEEVKDPKLLERIEELEREIEMLEKANKMSFGKVASRMTFIEKIREQAGKYKKHPYYSEEKLAELKKEYAILNLAMTKWDD